MVEASGSLTINKEEFLEEYRQTVKHRAAILIYYKDIAWPVRLSRVFTKSFFNADLSKMLLQSVCCQENRFRESNLVN